MDGERIRINLDGRTAPLSLGELTLRSDERQWSGFLLESHRKPARGLITEFSPQRTLVELCIKGRGTLQARADGRKHRFCLEPGRLSILGSRCELQSLSWHGPHQVLVVELCGSRLAPLSALEYEDVEGLALVSRFGIRDDHIAALISSMQAEVESGCPTGRLYAESLSLALASYLLGHYSAICHTSDDAAPKLSPDQFHQLRAYIDAHFSEDLSVPRLAKVVDLSPHYFSYVFKNTVGVTPHRYVLNKRIIETKNLLSAKQMPILDVALTVGFSSQSHLTDAFRRLTGTTPRQFQNRH